MEAKEFKKIIESISNLVDEICFEVDEEGIKGSSMDPSHVALGVVTIPKDSFEEYEANTHDLGIDLEALKKIMARSKSNEKLVLSLDENKNKLDVIFKGKGIRKFSISLYDVALSTTKVPEIPFPNEVLIKADSFVEALKDAELVNDHVSLEVNEKGEFIISSKGDINENETIYSRDDECIIDLKVSESTKSTYSIAYLKDITKSTSADDILHIYLGKECPVKIEYNIGNAELVFLLAPRIESV